MTENSLEKQILDLVAADPPKTFTDLSKEIGISIQAISSICKNMQNRSLIKITKKSLASFVFPSKMEAVHEK